MVDEHDYDDEPAEGPKGILPESIKKALVTGISAVFMTEEGIRGALSDMRLPKEAMTYFLQQTQSTRRELLRIISVELKDFLKNTDITGAMRKALTGMKLEVKAEIRFVDEGKTQSKAKVSVQGDEEDEGDSDPPTPRRKKSRSKG